MQLKLVEENLLARARMAHDGGPPLKRAQAVRLPLELHRSGAAVSFHLRRVVGLEEILPANVETGREVADVQQFLLLKPLEEIGGQRLVNLAAVNDRRLAALVSHRDAIEELAHGPAMHVRAFVVK